MGLGVRVRVRIRVGVRVRVRVQLLRRVVRQQPVALALHVSVLHVP